MLGQHTGEVLGEYGFDPAYTTSDTTMEKLT
jgi:hypothetical protein